MKTLELRGFRVGRGKHLRTERYQVNKTEYAETCEISFEAVGNTHKLHNHKLYRYAPMRRLFLHHWSDSS